MELRWISGTLQKGLHRKPIIAHGRCYMKKGATEERIQQDPPPKKALKATLAWS